MFEKEMTLKDFLEQFNAEELYYENVLVNSRGKYTLMEKSIEPIMNLMRINNVSKLSFGISTKHQVITLNSKSDSVKFTGLNTDIDVNPYHGTIPPEVITRNKNSSGTRSSKESENLKTDIIDRIRKLDSMKINSLLDCNMNK